MAGQPSPEAVGSRAPSTFPHLRTEGISICLFGANGRACLTGESSHPCCLCPLAPWPPSGHSAREGGRPSRVGAGVVPWPGPAGHGQETTCIHCAKPRWAYLQLVDEFGALLSCLSSLPWAWGTRKM